MYEEVIEKESTPKNDDAKTEDNNIKKHKSTEVHIPRTIVTPRESMCLLQA